MGAHSRFHFVPSFRGRGVWWNEWNEITGAKANPRQDASGGRAIIDALMECENADLFPPRGHALDNSRAWRGFRELDPG